MLSWNEYLSIFVETFRSEFEKLGADEQKAAQANLTFIKPCQIEVVEFKPPFPKVWIVTLDKNRPDMEFIIHEKLEINPQTFLNEHIKKDPNWLQWSKEMQKTNARKIFLHNTKPASWGAESWRWLDEKSSIYSFYREIRSQDPQKHALERAQRVAETARERLELQRKKEIEKAAKTLKRFVPQVAEKRIRSKLLETTGKIDSALAQMKRIDEHERKIGMIEEEIGGVRRLIGVSKEFQDWRTLTSTVEDLKMNQISREIFNSEIKRLDQRINDLKTIKLWSIRTIIEILLAIAALIATLIATGVIRF